MLTDGWTDGGMDGKAEAYVTPCYKQVWQKWTVIHMVAVKYMLWRSQLCPGEYRKQVKMVNSYNNACFCGRTQYLEIKCSEPQKAINTFKSSANFLCFSFSNSLALSSSGWGNKAASSNSSKLASTIKQTILAPDIWVNICFLFLHEKHIVAPQQVLLMTTHSMF